MHERQRKTQPATTTAPTPKPARTATSTTRLPAWSGNNAPAPGLFVQAKLTINQPGDPYEQEADAIAEHIMRLDTPAATSATPPAPPAASPPAAPPAATPPAAAAPPPPAANPPAPPAASPPAAPPAPPTTARTIQRTCACGGTLGPDDEECDTCRAAHTPIQRKPALTPLPPAQSHSPIMRLDDPAPPTDAPSATNNDQPNPTTDATISFADETPDEENASTIGLSTTNAPPAAEPAQQPAPDDPNATPIEPPTASGDQPIPPAPQTPAVPDQPAPTTDRPNDAPAVIAPKRDATNTPSINDDWERELDHARRQGQPLNDDLRAFFEPRFGVDFANVRLHTDSTAQHLSHQIGAHAFATGQDIFFAAGRYAPTTRAGRQLLAHELTHVVQQTHPPTTTTANATIPAIATTTTPLVARQPAPKTATPLETLTGDFEWRGQGFEARLLVRKSWLLAKTPNLAKDDIITTPDIIAPIAQAMRRSFTWLTTEEFAKFSFQLGPLHTEPAQLGDIITFKPVDRLLQVLGLPPGQEIHWAIRNDGMLVWIDKRLLIRYANEPRTDLSVEGQAFGEVYLGSLERFTGLTLGGKDRAARDQHIKNVRVTFAAPIDRLPRAPMIKISTELLQTYFGTETWNTYARAPRRREKTGTAAGQIIHIPPQFSDKLQLILPILRKILTPAEPSNNRSAPDIYLSERAVNLLLGIARNPLKPQIMAILSQRGTVSGDPIALEDLLESAIATARVNAAAKRLGIATSTTPRPEPLVKRPVRGQIINRGGILVPKKEAEFVFEVKDNVPIWAVPSISIDWVAYPKGKPKSPVRKENTSYNPVRSQGLLNDQIFQVTFETTGTYVIEAIVDHNFYFPNWFSIEVLIRTEQEVTANLEKDALQGFAGKPTTTKTEDFGTAAYAQGSIVRGPIDPAFKALTTDQRLKTIDDEITRIKDLLEGPRSNQTDGAVKEWATSYLKTLQDRRKKISDAATAPGTIQLTCQGVYVSRSKGIQSATLNLLCYFTKTGSTYTVALDDFSQVYERENYHVEASADTVEAACKALFVKHAANYPNGTLSLAFATWDEQKQQLGDQYVKFSKVTDTIGKDIKAIVFNSAVDIGVNVVAALLTIFPPTAPIGIGISIAYNAARTLSDLEERASKDTLTTGDVVLGVGMVALDLLPVIGKSQKFIKLGTKSLVLIEGVQFLGQNVILTAQGLKQVETIRNGVISQLAGVEAQIRQIEQSNLSDPRLPDLYTQREQLKNEGREATINVFKDLAATQGIMLIGTKVAHEIGRAKFGPLLEKLRTSGKFASAPGEVHYDYQQQKIVGDETAITQGKLEQAQRRASYDEQLGGALPTDPAKRQQVIETIGDREVKIDTNASKTSADASGEVPTLRVAPGATPDEILAAAKALRDTTPPAPKPDEAPAKKATEPTSKAPGSAAEPKPREDVKVATADGHHELTVTKDGQIYRCSDLCMQLRQEYLKELADHPELNKDMKALEALAATETDNKTLAELAKDIESRLAKARTDANAQAFAQLQQETAALEPQIAKKTSAVDDAKKLVERLQAERENVGTPEPGKTLTVAEKDRLRDKKQREIDAAVKKRDQAQAELDRLTGDREAKTKQLRSLSPDSRVRSDAYGYEDLGKLDPCFPAGTLVHTPAGLRAIETLRAGDLVYAHEPACEQPIATPVMKLYVNHTEHLVDLHVAGTTISATRQHRFWVEGPNAWFPAVDLRPGELLRSVTGMQVPIAAAQVHAAPCTTYNLEVYRAHNFFVGTPGLLVHNGDEHSSKFSDVELRNVAIYKVYLKSDPTKIIYVGQTVQKLQDRLYDHAFQTKRVMPDGRTWADLYTSGDLQIDVLRRDSWTKYEAAVWELHFYRKMKAQGHPLQNDPVADFISKPKYIEYRTKHNACK